MDLVDLQRAPFQADYDAAAVITQSEARMTCGSRNRHFRTHSLNVATFSLCAPSVGPTSQETSLDSAKKQKSGESGWPASSH